MVCNTVINDSDLFGPLVLPLAQIFSDSLVQMGVIIEMVLMALLGQYLEICQKGRQRRYSQNVGILIVLVDSSNGLKFRGTVHSTMKQIAI